MYPLKGCFKYQFYRQTPVDAMTPDTRPQVNPANHCQNPHP